MEYRLLGRTDLRVSAISLGTVALGLEYGIRAPGAFGRPPETEALALMRQAADAGINLFDTAPGYGESERIVGRFLAEATNCRVATKVPVPRDAAGCLLAGAAVRRATEASLESSLRVLRRDALDIVQIHNATVEAISRGEIAEALLSARQQGKVRFLGASVYTGEEALAVISAGFFDALQVPYNLLDQRMAENVFPAAKDFGVSWGSLPEFALRFCLSDPRVSTILTGAQTAEELSRSLAATAVGPLPEDLLARAAGLALSDDRLLDPSRWPSV